jgi:hypothetical protein
LDNIFIEYLRHTERNRMPSFSSSDPDGLNKFAAALAAVANGTYQKKSYQIIVGGDQAPVAQTSALAAGDYIDVPAKTISDDNAPAAAPIPATQQPDLSLPSALPTPQRLAL